MKTDVVVLRPEAEILCFVARKGGRTSKGRIWRKFSRTERQAPPERREYAEPVSVDLNPVRKANQPHSFGTREARNTHRLLVDKRVIEMQARSVLEAAGNCGAQAAV
jgi:hypothetical protein